MEMTNPYTMPNGGLLPLSTYNSDPRFYGEYLMRSGKWTRNRRARAIRAAHAK